MGTRYQMFSDDFTRANASDLGSVWDAGYAGLTNLQIVGNRVRQGTLGNDCLESVNAPSFPADQWAQLTIATITGSGQQSPQCVLRAATPATLTCYVFYALRNGIIRSAIAKHVAGVFTSLVTENSTTWAASDTIRAEAQGTALRMYRNGLLLLSTTDSAIASGRPGLWIYGETDIANVEVEDFIAGRIGSDGSLTVTGCG